MQRNTKIIMILVFRCIYKSLASGVKVYHKNQAIVYQIFPFGDAGFIDIQSSPSENCRNPKSSILMELYSIFGALLKDP